MQAAIVYIKYASTFPAVQQIPDLSDTGAECVWEIVNIIWCSQSYKFLTGLVSTPKTTALMQQNLVT